MAVEKACFAIKYLLLGPLDIFIQIIVIVATNLGILICFVTGK